MYFPTYGTSNVMYVAEDAADYKQCNKEATLHLKGAMKIHAAKYLRM